MRQKPCALHFNAENTFSWLALLTNQPQLSGFLAAHSILLEQTTNMRYDDCADTYALLWTCLSSYGLSQPFHLPQHAAEAGNQYAAAVFLRLLVTWTCNCEAAVEAFLANPSHLPFLVDIVTSRYSNLSGPQPLLTQIRHAVGFDLRATINGSVQDNKDPSICWNI